MLRLRGCFACRVTRFSAKQHSWLQPCLRPLEHRVPYSKQVAELLDKRRAGPDGTPIFAGRTGAALTDVKRTWDRVRDTDGLKGVRLHDLRHTYASLLVSQGHPLPVIGALLGHTQAQTTARYAHLFDDPLRKATEDVSFSISN